MPAITYDDLAASAVYNVSSSSMAPMSGLYVDWAMRSAGFPHVVLGEAELEDAIDLNALVPEDFTVVRTVGGENWSQVLATSQTAVTIIEAHFKSEINVSVAAETPERAREVREHITGAVPPPVAKDGTVGITLWYLAPDGPDYTHKNILVPKWDDIARNYPGAANEPLDGLMKKECPDEENPPRLILWHGPPGTGKTYAVRALARAWREWCTMHYIADPEKIFANPGYLLNVAGSADARKWRLIVAEDADEFLRAEAREQAGAALGRLLNFTDGILGQGSKTLFLLTTNASIGSLHPAVQRPGRCLSQIQFDLFTPAQATEWAGGGYFGEDVSLAELVERRRHPDAKQLRTGLASAGAGTYL